MITSACASRYLSSNVDFNAVSAILCLATKYEAQALRRQAIQTLASAYPSTGAAWRQRAGARLFPPIENEFATVLALSLQNDVPSLLPALLFAACKRPVSEVISAILALPAPLTTVDDICRKFVEGRDRLREAEIKHVLRFLEPSFLRPHCQNYNSDGARLQLYAPRALSRLASSSPYDDWCMNEASRVSGLGLCDRCEGAVQQVIREAEEIIWREIPHIFGFPSWEVLQARDEL